MRLLRITAIAAAVVALGVASTFVLPDRAAQTPVFRLAAVEQGSIVSTGAGRPPASVAQRPLPHARGRRAISVARASAQSTTRTHARPSPARVVGRIASLPHNARATLARGLGAMHIR